VFIAGAVLLIEMVGDADRHFPAPEEYRGLEEEGRLVMEEVLPPFGWQELGQNNRM